MAYEVVSTASWNVLGTFEDESIARAAVVSLGVDPHDVVVYVSDDAGEPVDELADAELARWAGISPLARFF